MGNIRLYFKYFSIRLRSEMQYKASFFMSVFGQFLTSFATFLTIYFLFQRFSNVDGYTFSEILICYSSVIFAFSTAECFFRGFDGFARIIGNGEFDRMMVRPRPLVLQVMGQRIEFTRIGRFLQSIAILIYALPASGIIWTPDKIFALALMIIGETAVFTGLFIIYASICFFTLEGLEFMNVFTDGGRELGSYPIDIYGRGVLIFYTFVVPLACAQYYPFRYIIGRTSDIAALLTPVYCFIFLIPCYFVWRLGVRHYRSSGS
ncbi:MAG: ABC-2 family transporter protein [Eubacteriales bacterium]